MKTNLSYITISLIMNNNHNTSINPILSGILLSCISFLQQNVIMGRLAKTACLLAVASTMRNVITSMVAVLTTYVHQAGRAITAA